MTKLTLTLWLVAASLAGSGAAAQSSSASYVLRQSTLASGAAASTSTGFRLTFCVGQPAPVGASSALPYVLQSGFWSFAGAGPIPVVLAVDRNRAEPQHCDLHWSGNDAPYDIYAGDCSDVFASFVASSSANSLLNVTPSAGALTCFNVVSSPSPLHPRGGVPDSRGDR